MSKASEHILAEVTHEWHAEQVVSENGIRLHIEGAEFPQKGLPTPDALYAVNIVKKLVRYSIKLCSRPQFYPVIAIGILFPSRKFISSVLDTFNVIARSVLDPYRLPPQYSSPFERELDLFIFKSLTKAGISNMRENEPVAWWAGKNISAILDFDMAYRWRIQDILSETTPEKLFTHAELKRLTKLIEQRDEPRIARTAKQMIWAVRLILLIPFVRKSLRYAIMEIDFTGLQFDEADRYWCCFRTDYKFFGMSDQERMDLVKEKGWKIPISYEIQHD